LTIEPNTLTNRIKDTVGPAGVE